MLRRRYRKSCQAFGQEREETIGIHAFENPRVGGAASPVHVANRASLRVLTREFNRDVHVPPLEQLGHQEIRNHARIV